MNIKSYYMTKNDIVIKDYDNNTTILELNRQNLMNMINDLDSQVKESADEIISNEDNTYRRLINTLSLTTLAQLFLTYIVFAGFTHASLIGMILGIILSLGLVIFSFIITILELNRQNLMNMINDLDTQVKESADEIISKEDQAYRKLINVLSINTLASLFLSFIVFLGFTHASYIGMVLGIILSLGLVVYSLVMTFLGAKKIRGYRKQYRIYEGREILLNMYNKLSKGLDAELVDVY